MSLMEQTQLTTEELNQKVSEQEHKILDLEKNIKELTKTFTDHGHTGKDKSLGIKGNIQLESYNFFAAGNGMMTGGIENEGLSSEVGTTYILNGKDKEASLGFVTKNTQLMLQHNPNLTLVPGDPAGESFLHCVRPPVASGYVSVVSGGNSFSDSNQKFVESELVNAHIIVIGTDGTVVSASTVTANTETSITIAGTFNATIDAIYTVFKPAYLGSVNLPWKRLYVTGTANGGIRFGHGTTSTNCHLYTVGNTLYFKNASGTLYTVNLTAA